MKLATDPSSPITNQPYPLTVYFDGGCKLCTSEIDNIRARDVLRRLRLINCNTSSFDYAAAGATREAMLNAIHARTADGNWLRGVDVFIAMYAAINLSRVAKVLAHPYVKPCAVAFYPWLVQNKHWLSRLGLHHVMAYFARAAKANPAKQAKQAVAIQTQAQHAHAASLSCVDGACQVATSPKVTEEANP